MKTPDEAPESLEKSGEKTRVLSRSYDILMVLNHHPDGLSLREVGHYVKLPRSTVRRILDTLEEQNIVITAPSSSVYRLGPTLALFASNIRPFDITKIARPMLMQAASQTDESIYLCIRAHAMAVVVDLIRGVNPLHTVTTMGTSLPLHATACGKALLATLPDAELEALRSHKRVRYTARTLTDWEPLRAEIEEIRRTGVAYDHEEHQVGTSGLAIPIQGPGGEFGTVSIPLPTARCQSIGPSLVQCLVHNAQGLHWKH